MEVKLCTTMLGASKMLVMTLLLLPTTYALPPCTTPPPELPNGTFVENEEERLVLYNCDNDFWLRGPSNLTCITSADGDDTWVPEPWPECLPKGKCPEISLEHGDYDGECCVPGNNVSFYCLDEERYRLSGADSAICQPNGNWSSPIPTCEDTYCKDPGVSPVGNRVLFLGPDVYNKECCPPETSAVFTCPENYELEGEMETTCTSNGNWSHPRPKCRPEGACDDFDVINGIVRGKRSGGEFYVPGDSVFVSCYPGFRVNGTDQLYCEDDGYWDDDVPVCVEYNCTRFEPGPHLVVDEFKYTNNKSFPEGTAINFHCERGYVLDGIFSTVCKNGGWFGRIPKCEEIRCGPLRGPQYGWMAGNYSTAVGATVSLGCFQGYKLLGADQRTCGLDGQWDGEPARCVPNAMIQAAGSRMCLDPGTPDNGVRFGLNTFSVGSRIRFACNSNYHMRGNYILRCLEGGKWSSALPVCIGKFYFDKTPDVRDTFTGKTNEIRESYNESVADHHAAEGRTLYLDAPGVKKYYIYFLFDASSSIGEKNFRTGVNLAKAITRKVNVTRDGHHVGAIVFTKSADLIIDPVEVHDQDTVLRRLDGINYTAGGTSINAALAKMKTNVDTVRRQGKNIAAFLITDGKANIGGSASKEADFLKKAYNVEIYCIGITGRLQKDALEKLASDPIDEHLFILRDFDALKWLAEKLTNGTVDYGECGISYSHNVTSGFSYDDSALQGRIYQGDKVVTAWPWMVEMALISDAEKVACGATIIAKKWLLTAAHCLHHKNDQQKLYQPTDLRLRAGLVNRKNSSFAKELVIEAIVRHEDYNGSTFHNDIALLQLKDEIKFEPKIRPICLPPGKENIDRYSDFYKPGKVAFAVGWGVQKSKAQASAEHLMQLKMTIGSEAECRKAKTKYYRPDIMMCSKSNIGDTCNGDSGGPLMQGVQLEENIWTQVGIVSHGRQECKENSYSFYTDVSYYVDWIDRQMKRPLPGAAQAVLNARASAAAEVRP
nr:complement C2-like [Dermacentor andersoni]